MKKRDLIEQIDISVESVNWWKNEAREAITEGDKINDEIIYFQGAFGLPLICPYCEKKLDKLQTRLINIAQRMDFLIAKGAMEEANLSKVRERVEKFYGYI